MKDIILSFDNWIKKTTIIIDSREKKIEHILKIFNNLGVNYIIDCLQAGDYAFLYNDKIQKCIIERKNSLDELSINLTSKREQFNNEFEKLAHDNNIVHLLIENYTISNIIDGLYNSNMSRNSFIGSILSFMYRYNIHIHFVPKKRSAYYICNLFYYYSKSTM